MKVVYLAAGAADMICGSCLRDNRLVLALRRQGRDVTMFPLYTPLRLDEAAASDGPLYFGGLNVYLQTKSAFFRRLPRFVDRILDNSRLVRWLSGRAASTRAEELGAITIAMLQGDHGPLRKEVDRLIEALRPVRADIVNLPDALFVGIAEKLKRELGTPILCTLSGEDLFLDGLVEPFRAQARELIRAASQHVDRFVSVSRYYADHCVTSMGIARERMRVAPLGVRCAEDPPRKAPAATPFVIAYVGRICPAKGLLNLADALVTLRRAGRDCRVVAAGHLPSADQPYLEEVRARLLSADALRYFDYRGEVSYEEKRALLRSAHLFTIPTNYRESKGLPVLEALVEGTPAVQPRHGSFPEIIEDTGGGVLYDPAAPDGLATALAALLDDPERRERLSSAGYAGVRASYSDGRMASETWKVYEELQRSAP